MTATPEGKAATIKVSFKAKKTGKTSKYTFTSKVTVVAEEEPKTDAFEMTSLKATSANVLTATFANAVASEGAVKIKVTKAGSTTEITGTTKWSEDLTTATFTASAKLTAGTYEMTATDAADSTKKTSKTAVVENEKVAEIVIKNDVALTGNSDPANGKNRDLAYIYYDVLNQYGESVRNSTSINWTVSTDQTPKINKSTGKITAQTSAAGGYVYGTSIYVTGVYAKTGVTIQKELKVGMEQALDTIETIGFVKNTDKNTILKALPTNFQKNQYVMIYEAYDQNGDVLDASDVVGTEADGTNSADVTFISDNVLLIKNDFKDADSKYTINGNEYSAVKIEPGQYVDKGGEVNITAIANKTGNKTIKNYVVGAAKILKSVVLSQPSTVVADGETNVEIPFVATDIEGNQITNYESIVRTTNTLNLTASEGTLAIKEQNDGTAKFVFSDAPQYRGYSGWEQASSHDDVSRSVALTTVVVGGESNNFILSVDDKARPVAVKAVTFRKDATTAVVGDDSDAIDYKRFTFVDQYGREIWKAADGSNNSNQFFEYLSKNGSLWNGNYYAIKAEFNKNDSNFAVTTGAGLGLANVSKISGSGNNAVILRTTGGAFGWYAKMSSEVMNETIKWSVVSAETNTTDVDKYNYCDKPYSVSYTVVPMAKTTGITINSANKQYIPLGLGSYATGAEADMDATDLTSKLNALGTYTKKATVEAAVANIAHPYKQTLGVSASYQGVKVVVPATYVEWDSTKLNIHADALNTPTPGAILSVNSSAAVLGDFYDAKSTNLARKDGKFSVTARVYSVTAGAVGNGYIRKAKADYDNITGWNVASCSAFQMAAPTMDVVVSDADPAATKIELVGEKCTVNPNYTALGNLATTISVSHADKCDTASWPVWGGNLVCHNKAYDTIGDCKELPRVFDQYGVLFTTGTWTFTISDVVENKNELAHLDNSFAVQANSTNAPFITGAEIGDTFTLTYKVDNATAALKVTVGADIQSVIDNYGDWDKDFRTHILSYAY